MSRSVGLVQHEGQWHAFFAFQLRSMAVADHGSNDARRNSIKEALDRQVEFIASLAFLRDGNAVELRYLSHPMPDAPHKGVIDVLLRVRISGSDKEKLHTQVERAREWVAARLAGLSDTYVWQPMTGEDCTALLKGQSDWAMASILRREFNMPLDSTIPLLRKPIGLYGGEPDDRGVNAKQFVRNVSPFIRTTDTLAGLFRTWLSLHQPVALSIALSPTRIDERELEVLVGGIKTCEEHMHMADSRGAKTERFQARSALKVLGQRLLSLYDDCFLMRIQVAMPNVMDPAMPESVGVAMTEPVAATRNGDDEFLALAGGYDWVLAESDEQRQMAQKNWDYIRFDRWWDIQADNPHSRLRILFDPVQANAAFRLPVPIPDVFPGIEERVIRFLPPPIQMSSEGVCLGHNIWQGRRIPVYALTADRRRHMYIIGQTGTGKSSLLLQMILQDIEAGHGVGVIDPHGELVDDILARLPEERAEDLVYINPEYQNQIVGLNLLDCRDEIDRDSAVNHLLEIFDKLYDLSETGGPMFEMYFRNAAYLALYAANHKTTLADIPLVFENKAFRDRLLKRCQNPMVVGFWKEVALRAGGESALPNIAPYITSKLTTMVYNRLIARIMLQQETTIDFLEVLDQRKILLVDLAKGRVGETNAAFLGMVIVSLLQRAAFSRTGRGGDFPDFFLYVDEFQNLASDSFAAIFSEARKYRLNLIVSNQYMYQLPDQVRKAVLGNVGTLLSLRIGSNDAEELQRRFGPLLGPADMMNLPNFNAYVSTLVHGESVKPFNIEITAPQPRHHERATVEEIIRRSLEKYGKPVTDVDREIESRWGQAT